MCSFQNPNIYSHYDLPHIPIYKVVHKKITLFTSHISKKGGIDLHLNITWIFFLTMWVVTAENDIKINIQMRTIQFAQWKTVALEQAFVLTGYSLHDWQYVLYQHVIKWNVCRFYHFWEECKVVLNHPVYHTSQNRFI